MQLFNKNTFSAFLTRTERIIHTHFPPITILAYHSISNDKTIVDISPYMFQRQIDILKEFCEFTTLDQVVDYIQNKKTFNKPAVALTFDDAYADVLDIVLPILAKDRIPAAVFTLSDVEHANRRELENSKELMTPKQLQLLHDMRWTIGCHSATHANFADKDLDSQKEIFDTKKQLENGLGFPVNYFVYPKGIYSSPIIEAVKITGYRAAFAFEAGFISEKTNLFTIPRMPVDWTHTEEQFNAFFTHWGICYLQMKNKLQNIL